MHKAQAVKCSCSECGLYYGQTCSRSDCQRAEDKKRMNEPPKPMYGSAKLLYSTTNVVEFVETPQLTRLRELRLWHWSSLLAYRNEAATCVMLGENSRVDYWNAKSQIANRKANEHMKFVQTLNDFFPSEDTAEKDAAS